MPRFKIAHVKKQGVDLIIVPLETAFGHKTTADQQAIIAELQAHATGANLRGTVVPVWDAGGGRMGFIAPPRWHPFFKGLTLLDVMASINRELYW